MLFTCFDHSNVCYQHFEGSAKQHIARKLTVDVPLNCVCSWIAPVSSSEVIGTLFICFDLRNQDAKPNNTF